MNFYAASNMPVYRVEKEKKEKPPKTPKVIGSTAVKRSKMFAAQAQKDGAAQAVRPVTSSSAVQHDASSIDRLLGPAVDGPPSPGSLRELSQQVKRASALD